jgi:hypothetical protein
MKRQGEDLRCKCSTTVESEAETPPPCSKQGAAKLVESHEADNPKGQRSRQRATDGANHCVTISSR